MRLEAGKIRASRLGTECLMDDDMDDDSRLLVASLILRA
jgi:hypothetical protein